VIRPAIICARGGSRGVPGKNLRELWGKPLIAWTVEQAARSGLFDTVAVSSDSPDILEAARAAGADSLVERPPEMATDTASVQPAILHCLDTVERARGAACDSFVFLQVTSPLRTVADIAGAVALWEAHRPGSVVSATPARSSPYFTIVEERDDGTVGLSKPTDPPVTRRQDAPRCWDLNGAIYVFDRARHAAAPRVLYSDTRLYEMPAERSLDIDTEADWAQIKSIFPDPPYSTKPQ
jgi:N-acylneuraminate cytidylyltransferase/CMP-N,N'-diacetyllegionaminic acid synthase